MENMNYKIVNNPALAVVREEIKTLAHKASLVEGC